MRDNRTAPLTTRLRRGQVCMAEGFGIGVRVDRQHLVVDDGSGRDRRSRRYARATHGLSRLVVVGNDGYITLDAIRWLRNLGIGYLHLDRDGTILATTETGSGDARLRRLQAHATTAPVGVEVARHLLGTKVDGQARNLRFVAGSERSLEAIGHWRDRITEATALDQLLEAEREAAVAYWSCWAPLSLRFATRDQDRIPEHWQRAGARQSPLSNGGRVAVTPANAILNYLYAILESETRIACLMVGLDPGLGIWHADYRSRDSFALDLMEPARPEVDRYVLELLRTRTFTKKDFGETSRGICRILPPFTHGLAQTASQWRDAVAPHAEHVARLLAKAPGSRIDELSTPLTRENRRNQQADRQSHVFGRRDPAKPTPTCKCCGGPVPRSQRVYCDPCFARIRSTPTCKTCGGPVRHRKRVYCDPCLVAYEAQLPGIRRFCKKCGEPVPHRKRVYCDACIKEDRRPGRGSP